MKPEEVARHELIGLSCRVVESTDEGRVGVEGRVVAETRNTLTLENEAGEKVVPKDETVLEFDVDGAAVVVEGSDLVERPADRVGSSVEVETCRA